MQYLLYSFLILLLFVFPALADTVPPPTEQTFPDIVCGATKAISGILPSSPQTFESLSASISSDLPFLGPSLIASMLYDVYVVLKLVIAYKVVKILGGKL